jgi:tRNA 2-selenouridine synthase SelU
MALSHEDKHDVKKAYGKALANKVAKVTRDKKMSADIRKHPLHVQRQMLKENKHGIDYRHGLGEKPSIKPLYGADSKSIARSTMYRSKPKRTEPRNF